MMPPCMLLLQRTHRRLLRGVRGQTKQPGEFRTIQNYVGVPGCNVHEAEFVFPPSAEIVSAIHHFENYVHQTNDLPPLVRIALAHYQFETIHPF